MLSITQVLLNIFLPAVQRHGQVIDRKLSSFPDNLLRPPKPPNLLFFSNFNNLSNFMQSLRLVFVERSFARIYFWFIENTFWGGPHEYFLFLFWCFYSWGNRLLTPMNPIHSTTFKVASWNILKKRKVEDILIENSRKEMKRVTISSLQEKNYLIGNLQWKL